MLDISFDKSDYSLWLLHFAAAIPLLEAVARTWDAPIVNQFYEYFGNSSLSYGYPFKRLALTSKRLNNHAASI